MRTLITGVTGFAGSHLAEYLLDLPDPPEIHGLVRWRSPRDHVRHLGERITYHEGDLRDLPSLIAVLQAVRPDRIHHLAAQSHVPTSYRSPVATMDANATGTVNLLEAVRQVGLDCRIQICSTSEVYGRVRPEDSPIREECPLNPLSPYALGKCAADLAGAMYHQAHGLAAIRSRGFNHSGPRRGEVFVDSFFALQIARIERGLQEPEIRVGDLTPVRTFCDVRDIVRGYHLLLEHGEPGEVYNLGGETTISIQEVLDRLLDLAGQRGEVKIRRDPSLLRPVDIPLQVPCSDRFHALTGWKPRIPYEQTLGDMLEYWGSRLDVSAASG